MKGNALAKTWRGETKSSIFSLPPLSPEKKQKINAKIRLGWKGKLFPDLLGHLIFQPRVRNVDGHASRHSSSSTSAKGSRLDLPKSAPLRLRFFVAIPARLAASRRKDRACSLDIWARSHPIADASLLRRDILQIATTCRSALVTTPDVHRQMGFARLVQWVRCFTKAASAGSFEFLRQAK